MDIRLSKNRALLAAYLNMAQQNVYVTLLHISQLMGVEETKDLSNRMYDFQILQELKTGKKGAESEQMVKSERVQKIILLLYRNFPFLKAFVEAKYKQQEKNNGGKNKGGGKNTQKNKKAPDNTSNEEQLEFTESELGKLPIPPHEYRTILCDVFRLINDLRNEYTHFSPEKRTGGAKESHEKCQKKMLSYLYLCLDGGRRVVKERFKDTFQEKDFNFLTQGPRYSLQKDGDKKKAEERPNFYYRLKDDQGLFSYVGILLFISLFLHKRYISEMLAQSGLFYTPRYWKGQPVNVELERRIISEIFSIYRIRLPKERIDSTRPDYALGLDMLNELQKCPNELYETFSPKDQAEFRVKREYDESSEGTEEGEVLLKRFDDRFPYFAIRYLDENRVFDDIRFQVSIGKYRYKFYNKLCIDVVSSNRNDDCYRLRSLQKEINGFGRLNEVEYERILRYGSHIHVEKPEGDDTPYLTDHHTSYLFNGNRIGLLFNQENGRHDLEEIRGNCLYLPHLTFASSSEGKDARCVPPIAWLSTYELPALIFHHLLCRHYGLERTATESIIKECVGLYYRLFTDIRDGKLLPGEALGIQAEESTRSEISRIKKGEPLPQNISEKIETFLSTHYCTEQVCLHIQDIPKKIIDYLIGKNIDQDMSGLFKQRSRERINKMYESTKIRLKKFKTDLDLQGNGDNKFGKKRYTDIRPGQLADYLAKDLLLFQPYDDEKKNKVTGLNYQILQAALAIYNHNLDELRQLFKNARLLVPGNPKMQHPFLKSVLQKNPRTTLQFYAYYLLEKISYLEERLADPNETFADLFRYKQRQKWQTRDSQWYRALAGRYMAEMMEEGTMNFKPIELPRGLFERPIKRLLTNILTKRTDSDSQALLKIVESPRCNVSYLIAQYFTLILHDDSQPFYHPNKRYKRTYQYFNILNNRKERNKLVQVYYTLDEMEAYFKDTESLKKRYKDYLTSSEAKKHPAPEQRLKKYLSEYRKNETTIRRYRVQDMLVFLMAKILLLEKGGLEAGELRQYKLSQVQPTTGQNSGQNILSLQVPFNITVKLDDGTERSITQEAIKVKNYGDFFRFLYDDRVASLLPYTQDDIPLERALLEKELEGYDRERIPIFKSVHCMEKEILRLCPELNDPKSSQYKYTTDIGTEKIVKENFRAMLTELCSRGLLPENEIEMMVEIRNSFSHNRYACVNLKGKNIPMIAISIQRKFDGVVGRTIGKNKN